MESNFSKGSIESSASCVNNAQRDKLACVRRHMGEPNAINL